MASNNFSGVGGPGIGTLKLDGKVEATKTMAKTLPMSLQWNGCFDIGPPPFVGCRHVVVWKKAIRCLMAGVEQHGSADLMCMDPLSYAYQPTPCAPTSSSTRT